jgi:septin family protein
VFMTAHHHFIYCDLIPVISTSDAVTNSVLNECHISDLLQCKEL